MASTFDLESLPVTIALGASLSGALPIGAKGMVGIAMPAAWTAAALSFQISLDGGVTWLNLFDQAGTEVTVATGSAAASQFAALDPKYFRGATHIKVRSGTAGSPVNQDAERILGVAIRTVTW